MRIVVEQKSPSLRAYRTALERYVEGGGEPFLTQAYELGRNGLDAGAGVMHIVHVHWTAVNTVIATASDDQEIRRRLHASTEFLVEALSPFEMAYRGYCDLARSAAADDRL